MGSSKTVRISQEAFDAVVNENIDDLGMDPQEALEDAIQTLTLQGVDLSGIIKCIPGSAEENPVFESLNRLKVIAASTFSSTLQDKPLATESIDQQTNMCQNMTLDLEEMIELLGRIYGLCSLEGSENASIATRNGGVELLCSICSSLQRGYDQPLVSALKTLTLLLHDLESTEMFRQCAGPKILMEILNNCGQNVNILDSGFGVVAAAATGNEVLKESFVDLKIDDFFVEVINLHIKGNIHNLYDAICVLLTPDDNRVLASQVYGYARRFAKIGIAGALVEGLHEGIDSSSLVSVTIALKAIAVNDEICRSIAENGGLDALLQCIDDSDVRNNKTVARACCSLLSKLAGSDANKSAIVQKGGLGRLVKLSSRFSEDPAVLQEIMLIICTLSLRSPENATSAIEAGTGDFTIEAMNKFPGAHQMQRQACLMIRNLVVRNPENRPILLSNGVEKLIRKAKENHVSCKDAATAALRDLGLDDYNS